jgi:hypothetical protein
VQNSVAEALRIKVMEGNTAMDIFSYMLAEEMIHAALINTGICDKVKDVYNNIQRYKFLSSIRLCECTHVIQGATM